MAIQEGVEAHKGGVRLFVGGFLGHLRPGASRRPGRTPRVLRAARPVRRAALRCSPPHLRAPLLRPILEAVLGEEVPGVEVRGRPVSRGVAGASGAECGLLESLGVYPEVALSGTARAPRPRRPGSGSLAAPRALRAEWTVWRRLLEAALRLASGQRRSMIRSRVEVVVPRQREQLHPGWPPS